MEQLRYGWYSDRLDLKDIFWHENYDAMICYGKVYGSCNVFQHCQCQLPDGRIMKLGTWLNRQRTGKVKNILTKERLHKLQLLVDANMLDWKLDRFEFKTDNNKWNEMYNYLLEYGDKQNGNCNVPQSYILTLPDNTEIKLG